MNKTTNIDPDALRKLYAKGYSMKRISEELGYSEHKIVYWMGKYNILRRTRSEANYAFYNPEGDPFSIKRNLDASEEKLMGLGLGIYWGEGDKVSKYQLRVTNTDPDLIKVFIKFLRDICQLKEDKISYHLICFNDSDIVKCSKYWSNQLKISEDKFGKIVQIAPQGKGTYRRKSQFGVCTVIVSNIKLKAWVMQELQNLRK